jgi:predicted DCC family thiol-disulfide oxidoreductase YuxK
MIQGYLLSMMEAPTPASCTVYYDGACPVCRAEITHYQARAADAPIDWVDVSAPGALPEGLTREAALARFHVRDANGALLSGAAAFASLWREVPGWRWAGRIAAFALVTFMLDLGYRAFLKVRPLWRRPSTG